jgi:hypothetical protein
MYYIFKEDFMGNKVPCFAAQTNEAATRFMDTASHDTWVFHVKGNKRTIGGL